MINQRTFLLVIVAGCLLVGHLYGQEYSLSIFESEQCVNKNQFYDSTSVYAYLDELLNEDLDKGYFYAGYDSIRLKDSLVSAYYSRGKAFVWGGIRIVSDSDVVPFSKYIAKWKKDPPSAKRMQAFMQELTRKYNEIGYANCQIESKEIVSHAEMLDWELHIKTGSLFTLDSVQVISEQSFPEEILRYKSGLNPGTVFNISQLSALESGLFDPDFLKQNKAMQVVFTDTSYSVRLNYELESRNSFSGMLGIVPGNESQNLYLTGDVNLYLQNAFKAGEKIRFNWQAYEHSSQLLNLSYKQPVIIGAIGVVSDFLLDKQDSSFLDTKLKLGLFAVQRLSEISIYYEQNNSNLIQASIDSIVPFASVKHRKLGTQVEFLKLDDNFNPRKGFAASANLSIGMHSTDQEDSDKGMGEFDSELHAYFNTADRFGLHVKNINAMRYVGGGLKQNELYRIGGISTFRGFLERSVYTSAFNISSFEMLVYPDNYSSVYLFTDLGFVNSSFDILNNDISIYWSTGVGTRIQTNLGIIEIIYAIPYDSVASFDFRQSKIHIGYVNNF